MNLSIYDLTNALETIAPLQLQESYDNSGLIFGDKTESVSSALLTLDCTEEVVDEAIAVGAGIIIAHHPILFSGVKKWGNQYHHRAVIKAIKNNIAIYACHTNLDNVLYSGVNTKIAEKLGLVNCKILKPQTDGLLKLATFVPIAHIDELSKALFNAGCGNIGLYDSCSYRTGGIGTFRALEGSNPFVGKPGEVHKEEEYKLEVILPADKKNQVIAALKEVHPYEEVAYDLIPLLNENPMVGSGLIGELKEEVNALEFLQQIKRDFNAHGIRYTNITKEKVKRIALCGGSGSFLLNNAIAQKADMFITGDFKYHQFFDSDGQIIIADIGHYESEQFTPEIFATILNQKFPTFAVHLSKVKSNPINYL